MEEAYFSCYNFAIISLSFLIIDFLLGGRTSSFFVIIFIPVFTSLNKLLFLSFFYLKFSVHYTPYSIKGGTRINTDLHTTVRRSVQEAGVVSSILPHTIAIKPKTRHANRRPQHAREARPNPAQTSTGLGV